MSETDQAVDFAVLGMEALREELDRWKDAYAALRAGFRTVEQQRDEAQANALKAGENWWEACERARIYRGAAIHVFKEWCEDDQQACRNDLLELYPWLTDEAEL